MFVNIKKILYYFEDFSENIENYLNIKDGKIYEKDDLLALFDVNTSNDFIIIPKVASIELKNRYINQITDKSLKQKFLKIPKKDFDRMFHIYITDYNLLKDWDDFEKSELEKIATNWCEENGIKYTLK